MRTVEVSRTLVKSPPEVWAEIERVERLCELLGDDAIRVTASKPEQLIEWEGSGQRGTIALKVSGWGTKVSLTAVVDEEAEVAAEVEIPDEPVAVEPPPAETEVELPDEPAVVVPAQDEVVLSEAQPASEVEQEISNLEAKVAKQGLWTRIKLLFTPPDDRPRSDLGVEEVAPRSGLGAEDPTPTAEESPIPVPEPAPRSDLGAEAAVDDPRSDLGVDVDVEVVAADVVVDPVPEVALEDRLTAVLDHLGSAHKRPFSGM